ncbi:uncharacterized protein Pyn_05967 [Prunus yedoensis var. nudiflora]|uniref:Hemerythrin-like domain-containing protein n=1 Tax=Prunus yedoensis var. nudiflora TaxID=2094558 RepID=A0A314XKJ0_PRUYE|nr:uncharacterized protein Pyn_05967 [Prunus yedoensis var. nudiflora]
MGGDDNSPQCLLPPSTDDAQPASSSPSSAARVRLVHTPILFLVCFHKALRAELEDLRHVTLAALESASRDRQGRDFVLQLLRRFEFLKLAYKYHCSAEDEIIFLALDGRTKNVASTYSLEHRSIDGLFDSIFNRLDALLDESGNISKQFQELVFCIGTLQAFICQHMLKEENSNEQVTFEANNKAGGAHHTGESADLKKLLKSNSPKRFFEENRSSIKANCIHSEVGYNPVDGLHLWHAAIMKDLTKILEELYQLRSSSSFLSLDSIVVQLKFFADVLAFYSSALEKLFHPVLNELFNSCLYPSSEQFPNEIHVEGLQRLLYCTPENGTPLCKFVEKLCWELESFVVGINKHFAFQETKVFPIVRMNCSHDMQQQLLYVSLHILPLGLLKCTTTWFSACLSEDESRSILSSLKQGDSLVNKSFASLLHEWFRIGHSGKTSVEKFRKDLQQIFKSRCTSLSKQFYDTSGSSSLSSNVQLCEGSNTRLIAPISSDKGKNSMPYSSGTNIHIYFPGTMKTSHHLPESLSGENLLGYDLHEPKPVDLIFFFHKALKKDLEYLVFDPLEIVCTYLCGSGEQDGSVCYKSINCSDKDSPAVNTKPFQNSDVDEKPKDSDSNQCIYTDTEYVRPCAKGDKKRCQEVQNATNQINDPVQLFQASQKSKYCECLLTLGQEDLEAAIRKISRDSSLDPQKKSHMIQNLLMRQSYFSGLVTAMTGLICTVRN